MKELEILIGTNKVGKTLFLNQIKLDKIKNKTKTLFLGVGQDIEKFIKTEFEGSGSSKRNNPIPEIINFINEINSIDLSSQKIIIDKEIENQLKKMKNKYSEFKEKIKNETEDYYFEDKITNLFHSDIEDAIPSLEKIDFIKFISKNDDSIKKLTENFSSGTTVYSYFKLLVYFLKLNKEDINSTNFHLFIDEPETFCHPELINKISYEIYEISKIINVSVATHSPIFLNKIIQLKKSETDKNQKIKIKYFFRQEENEKNEYELPIDIEIFNEKTNKLNSREWKQLIECLFATNVILFEGLADEIFLFDIFYKYKKNDFIKKYIIFIDCGGKKSIEKMAKTLNSLKLCEKINILIFYDLDDDNKYIRVNNSFECIVQKPDLEQELFNYLINDKLFETKSGGKLSKIDLREKMNIFWILDNSSKENITTILEKKIKKLRKWLSIKN